MLWVGSKKLSCCSSSGDWNLTWVPGNFSPTITPIKPNLPRSMRTHSNDGLPQLSCTDKGMFNIAFCSCCCPPGQRLQTPNHQHQHYADTATPVLSKHERGVWHGDASPHRRQTRFPADRLFREPQHSFRARNIREHGWLKAAPTISEQRTLFETMTPVEQNGTIYI